jgi:hypothetical protein
MHKALTAGQTVITAGLSSVVLVGSSPFRRTLIISPPSNVLVTIGNTSLVTLGNGININQGVTVQIFRWSDFGDWIRQTLWIIASLAATPVGVLDVSDCGCNDNDDVLMGWDSGGVGDQIYGTVARPGGQAIGRTW